MNTPSLLDQAPPPNVCPCCGGSLINPNKPKPPRAEYTGIRADQLPDTMTRDEFNAYLDIKREEKPNDKFFADGRKIEQWLLSKGKIVLP